MSHKPQRLTWYELAALEEGTRVLFAEPHDIFPDALVKEAAQGVIQENGLNEIWSGMLVLPDDEKLRSDLEAWGGAIHLGSGLHPEGPKNCPMWHELSPLALIEGELPRVRMLAEWQKMADDAKPRPVFPDGNRERDGGDDWGSERQIAAENAFTDQVEHMLTEEKFEAYSTYCLKATTEEIIAEGMNQLRQCFPTEEESDAK